MRDVFDATVAWMADIPVREVPCLLCGQRDIRSLNTFVLNFQRFDTVRCQRDDMMWLDPQPTEPFYRLLYEEHYHVARGDDPLFEQGTLDVHSDEENLRQAAMLRLDEIERFMERDRFMEVGFGSGHTLQEARRRGWDVLGIELAQTCVDAMEMQGIPAIRTELPFYDGPEEAFGVIGMYSVIEHTHHPDDYLRRAHALLKPGGLLVLRLPDTVAEGPPASLLAHLYHFNSATIIDLLRRSHFEVLQVGAFGCWRPTKYPGELWSMNIISLVPNATFLCGDVTTIDLPQHSFDAVVSFFAIIHVPLAEQPTLFHGIHGWLKPGCWLMATVGAHAWTGTEENWLGSGAPMYWSHEGADTYLRWLDDAGFTVVWHRFVPEGGGGHTLVLAHV